MPFPNKTVSITDDIHDANFNLFLENFGVEFRHHDMSGGSSYRQGSREGT